MKTYLDSCVNVPIKCNYIGQKQNIEALLIGINKGEVCVMVMDDQLFSKGAIFRTTIDKVLIDAESLLGRIENDKRRQE